MDNPKIVIENPEAFGKELLQALANAEEGHLKVASDVGSGAVRRRLRENGFLRRIQPMKPIQPSDLTEWPGAEYEVGVVVDEMEIDQPGAVTLPLNETSTAHYYRAEKFITGFFKISTPEWTKNVHELQVLKKIDLEKMVIDNSLRDLQTREDAYYMNMVDTVIGAPGGDNSLLGIQQNFDYSDGGADEPTAGPAYVTRVNYKRYTVNKLQDRRLNNGIFLLNRKTATEFLNFDRSEIGGDLAETLFKEGLSGLPEFKIFGIPHLVTIKSDLVADGEVYQFTEPSFLGKAYSLKDVTMYVERKKDLIRSSAEEIIGISIANWAGLNKVVFEVAD